jgi:hypothetical protein
MRSEAQTNCYGVQMVPSFAKRLDLSNPGTWGNLAVKAARGAAPPGYWNAANCRDGGKWDLFPSRKTLPAGVLFPRIPKTAPPADPQPPAPPAPAPPAPPAPAVPSVVFDQTFEVDANRMDFPTVQINSARRVEIIATASSSGTGFWSCSQCILMDMGRGGEKRFAGFGVLELGRTHTVSIDNLSGTSSLLLSAYTAQGGTVYKPIEGLVGTFPFFELPGPLTIRVVGYR